MANTKGKYSKNKGRKNNYQKGMTKGNSTRTQRREAEDIDGSLKTFERSSTNDIAWYSRFPSVIGDAARVSFGTPLGQQIQIVNPSLTIMGSQNAPMTIPGIMTLQFIPTYGRSTNKDSIMNRASVKFYTYMRSHQKASAKYDSADQFMVMLALDNLNMLHKYLRRAVGLARDWTPVNYYYPRGLVEASGFSSDWLLDGNNLMALRNSVNQFAISLSQYPVPKGIDIFERHSWMCSGLYVDSSSTKAQTYMFVPKGFWIYDNTRSTGTALKWLDLENWMRTKYNKTKFDSIDQINDLISMMVAALLGDTDVGNICGDLLNAFGASSMRVYEDTPEGYQILPSYDPVVLSQIENATVIEDFATPNNVYIEQDPSINSGAILFNPKFKFSQPNPYLGERYKLLNIHHDNPTIADVVEATRLMTTKLGYVQGEFQLDTFGSDLISKLTTYEYGFSASGTWGLRRSDYVSNTVWIGKHTTDTSQNWMTQNWISAQLCCKYTAFDWHPGLALYSYQGEAWGTGETADPELMSYVTRMLDFENVAFLSEMDITELNNAVLLSLFDIPELKFYV